MLDPQSWLPAAQELSLGQRKRVGHDCGDGSVMLVEHKPDGYSAWCHRCSDKGWHPHPQPSLAERLARLREVKAVEQAAAQDVRPPMPANFDPSTWPLEARVWLYKAGLSNDRIQEIGAYYCDRLARVVLPVFDSGQVIYWQARGFDKDRPKYINPPIDKPVAKYGAGPLLVLTEDILSAVRVGEVTEAWSILGTSTDDALANAIRRFGGPVAIWLDGDNAGRKGRGKALRKVSLLGVDTRIIRTDLDPKCYSKEEIKQFLSI